LRKARAVALRIAGIVLRKTFCGFHKKRLNSSDVDNFKVIFKFNFSVVVIDVNDFKWACPVRREFRIFPNGSGVIEKTFCPILNLCGAALES
jgi:hypothetical protein